ncbi:uncharacterized protein BT62DRAFT_927881 [Guyanagaster necrorhizus]|uniref:RNA exonuclease 4 n=1 Tax=Guyanagaster necrorhizus TaxID=856835 RepID=A0A9P7W252_9AGAR|nr:uncharacterized protein BT62DRAFT_927881 [Guyanagaster necrorhizus MCA 3950]KAG7450600.1 hypothetical protein BT62DRAFT_927881 [Guyanagaster necrorhizus MCA 3950]
MSSKHVYGISCINVGVGPGGTTSMLARIAIVDYQGQVVLDTYVAPTMRITEYRTTTTGIEAAHLSSKNAMPFNSVQQLVASIIKGHVLVGHSIWNDLSVLGIPHPAVDTRDVALYQPFRNTLRSPNHIIGLQTLSWQLMRRRCQEGHLNPLENARAALDLYRTHAQGWEDAVSKGNWPCALPPSTFSRCYL